MDLAPWKVTISVYFFDSVLTTTPTRYRSTAYLVSLLLQGGYNSPHKTIDKYVQTFTDFLPSDGLRWIGNEPELPADLSFEVAKASRMDFGKMSRFFNPFFI